MINQSMVETQGKRLLDYFYGITESPYNPYKQITIETNYTTTLLDNGYIISPFGIRILLTDIIEGIDQEDARVSWMRGAMLDNMLSYGLLIGAITQKEFISRVIEIDKYPVTIPDISGDVNALKAAIVKGSLVSAEDVIGRIHRSNRKIVFIHGKFNIIHLGHLMYMFQSLEHVKNITNLSYMDLALVVAFDVGENEANSAFNSYWRASMIAHIPCVSLVFPARCSTENSSEYWQNVYKLVAPYAMNIDFTDLEGAGKAQLEDIRNVSRDTIVISNIRPGLIHRINGELMYITGPGMLSSGNLARGTSLHEIIEIFRERLKYRISSQQLY